MGASRSREREEAIPPPPEWALARVRELSERRIEGLIAREVPVIGDLAYLKDVQPGRSDPIDFPRRCRQTPLSQR